MWRGSQETTNKLWGFVARFCPVPQYWRQGWHQCHQPTLVPTWARETFVFGRWGNAVQRHSAGDMSAPMCHQQSPLKPLTRSLLKGFPAERADWLGESPGSARTGALPCLGKMRQCHKSSFLPQISSLDQAQEWLLP